MPSSFIDLGIMLAVIFVWFMAFKRPIYESIFISSSSCDDGALGQRYRLYSVGYETSLLYSMTVFTAMSIVLTKTRIIDGAVVNILSLFGRVPGGAGYVAVAGSTFALSGSGPGNVMSTGSIAIPAMKKSDFRAS